MLYHLRLGLRLHFRNTMALIYGYLFPLIYFAAFWVLYRYERWPVWRHMGELLTVSVLAGACFGLPTTLVSERERGVWRRYRLTPVSTRDLVVSTVAARYLLLITAGLLQFALAAAIGTPMPKHPAELFVAFTGVAFAFIGLGLVIAMLADTVPAVQALGQCIFLPMLIIGGVAVPLGSLPPWAQHLAAFFPGRYAVEAIQSCMTGRGLSVTAFSLLALTAIGLAGCLAAAKLFRWDAQQRFMAREDKGWLAIALGAWLAVGAAAEWRGHIAPMRLDVTAETNTPAVFTLPTAKLTPAESASAAPTPTTGQTPVANAPSPSAEHVARPAPPTTASAAREPERSNARGSHVTSAAPTPAASSTPTAAASAASATSGQSNPEEPPLASMSVKSWRDVIVKDIDEIAFNRLPPDGGIVTPVAPRYEEPDAEVADQLQTIADRLPEWKPAKVDDVVQRVRNLLYVAAVPDVFQMPIERFLPVVIFDHIQLSVPKDDLIKILFWIAMHPDEGDDSAMDDLHSLGLPINGPGDVVEARNRAGIYGLKLLGRVTGKITAK